MLTNSDTFGLQVNHTNFSLADLPSVPFGFRPTNCSKTFKLNIVTGLCHPVCGEWTDFSDETNLQFNIASMLTISLHLLGALTAIMFSFLHHKHM